MQHSAGAQPPGASSAMLPGVGLLGGMMGMPMMPTGAPMFPSPGSMAGMMPGAGATAMSAAGLALHPAAAASVASSCGGAGPMQAMLMQQQMLQQQQNMMAAQMMQQAAQQYDQEAATVVEPEALELQKEFKLDDRIIKDLSVQLKKRNQVEDDVKELYAILEGARNPAGMLRVKIREMEEGTYRGTATPDRDIEEMAKKFKLDVQASAKLSEVLSKRPDRKKDLRQINKHLELSNKPSSLVMLMLKDLRNGISVKDPEYPAAVGSYRHKMGLKGPRGRSRSRSPPRKKRRGSSDSSSSPPPPEMIRRAGMPSENKTSSSSGPRAMTLLERFG